MKLYRAVSRSPQDDFAIFHDATASLRDCIDFASRLLKRQPHADIWIDEEDWTSLTQVRYYWHRITGSHEGFGNAFQTKHNLSIAKSKVVWPETAVLKSRAEEFISGIESASDFVLVASPKYDAKYRCEVVVRSRYVLERAKNLRDSTFGGSSEDVLVRSALPIWLDRTQQVAKSPTVMPMPFFRLLDPWVGNFVEDGQASVFCLECKQTVSDIRTGINDHRTDGNRGEWNSSWECPAGHNLYSETHNTRLIVRPTISSN